MILPHVILRHPIVEAYPAVKTLFCRWYLSLMRKELRFVYIPMLWEYEERRLCHTRIKEASGP